MNIEQLYTECLAQGAYYIKSKNEAVIIDPLREVNQYIEKANKDGVKIKYIIETHFHADFVSGHVDLSKKTGATIIFGPNADTNIDAYIAKDEEEFFFGDVSFKVLHTPGHTLESSCFLLKDSNKKDIAVFTGDTLFIGDVGRPDLAQKTNHITKNDLAGMLYDSLQNKILKLNDDVLVYPAHGAGSACGKNMSKETYSTIGEQKENNYALRNGITKQEFIEEVTDGILPPPGYFGLNVSMNKNGYDSMDEIFERSLNPLSLNEFCDYIEDDTVILDTRNASDFAQKHIPKSISIGLEGQFAPWVGAIFPNLDKKIALVCSLGKEKETIQRLSRVGYDQVIGYLDGGIDTWINNNNKIESIDRISPEELSELHSDVKNIIDVRKPGEFNSEHVENAISLPLDFIHDNMSQYPSGRLFIHCAGGYRSIIAASILKANGYDNLCDIIGGYDAISETAIPKTDFVCPNS